MRNSLKELLPSSLGTPQGLRQKKREKERERARGKKSEDLLWEKEIEDAVSVAVRSVYRVA